MHPIVVGTAGHIDHGKTELVRALTGIDPTRFKEERERGITIDLGFAYLDYADGARLAFIDVPGHERFVHNMLAGACGIDVVLMVVAADESVKPQTREHAEICRLLGVRGAVVALTKTDRVDAETLDVVRLEVADFASRGALARAEIVPVSTRDGRGLEDLKRALRRAADAAPGRDAGRPLRLPVDRVFSAHGFGTVITGTLWAGRMALGQEVEIHPGGCRARVRGLQVHHRKVEEALAGQRVAVNLQGVSMDLVERGSMLMEPGMGRPARLLLARLELVEEAARLGRGTGLALHHAALETDVRWRWLDEPALEGGTARGLALLFCRQPAAAARGDRFVLRRRSPAATLGGGEVLDAPASRRSRAALVEHAGRIAGASPQEALVEDLRWRREPAVDAQALWLSSGLDRTAFDAALQQAERDGRVWRCAQGVWIESGRADGLEKRALELLEKFHTGDRLEAGMSLEEFKSRLLGGGPRLLAEWILERLRAAGRVRVEADRVALSGHRVALADSEAGFAQALERAFREAGLSPPETSEALQACGVPVRLGDKLLHLLVRSGVLVRIKSGGLYHAEAMGRLVGMLRGQRDSAPRIDVGRFKEITGTSRKNAIPLLEHLDATRVTRREGNERIIL